MSHTAQQAEEFRHHQDEVLNLIRYQVIFNAYLGSAQQGDPPTFPPPRPLQPPHHSYGHAPQKESLATSFTFCELICFDYLIKLIRYRLLSDCFISFHFELLDKYFNGVIYLLVA